MIGGCMGIGNMTILAVNLNECSVWMDASIFSHNYKMVYDENNYQIKNVLRPNLIGYQFRVKRMLEIPDKETNLWELPNV